MPRKSKAILDEEADYAILGDILKDSTLPAYQRLKAGGTRNAIRRTQAKRKAEKDAAAAKREAAEPVVYHNVLPPNGREPANWKPTGPVTPWSPPSGVNRP